MKQIAFELLCQIFGLSLISGMNYQHQQLDVVGPQSSTLYHYDFMDQYQQNINLSEQAQLWDLSAMAKERGNLYVFSSGKTPQAQSIIELHQLTKEIISIESLDILYGSMQQFIAADQLNIQGVVHLDNTWYFFNAPTNAQGENGLFVVNGQSILDDFNLYYTKVKLPKIKSKPLSFVDAVAVGQDIYFLANTQDQSQQASLLALLDMKKLKVKKSLKIQAQTNFSSIALKSTSPKMSSFLLSAPRGNADNSVDIYELQIN